LSMMNVKSIALLWAREKMPFEVTPFFLYLTRIPNGPRVGHALVPESAPEIAAK
jgi:hypothetical protein